MDKDPRKTHTLDGEKRKRKSTYRKDDKKSRGKQRKQDKSVEKPEETKEAKEKDSEPPSTSRPPSPDPNCSICLGDLQNKSFTDSCFHMFCFVCLKEWSKVKAECPLCKQKFKNIIYNVKSYEKYDRYNIAEEESNRNQWENYDGTRFRYRTTLTFERRFTIGPEHNYTQPVGRPSSVTTRSHWQRYREPATSEFRRRIYNNGMRAAEIADRRLRTRDTTPSFYRRNPAQIHRLVPWLNRELNSILHNQPDHVQLVMEIIMGLIKTYSIDSEEFYQHVYPYVGRHTRHFMHEFMCFAKSPYNMATYDSHVIYQPGALTINSDSDESSIDVEEDDEYVDEVIDVEDENSNQREPRVERHGNSLNDLNSLSPLLQSIRDIVETETPGSSMNVPLSMSGWDSPTPGPSWMSLSGDLELPPSTSATGTIPVVGNRESSPIDIGSTSDTDSDSTVSADSDGSDIVFVKIDKPWEARSPIMLSSDNTDDERQISSDFINKHYPKRKLNDKKKEHKKHKEHRKHKHAHGRESSKERHKHKKHKKHHSSDKSHRRSHSSSKHRDSGRSRSSSKHGENERSASSSKHSDFENCRSSLGKEKHHKKHKKHRKQEHDKKSKSGSKIQSVIVLPNSVNSSLGNTVSGTVSSEPLFPAASVITGHSTVSQLNTKLSTTGPDFSYKKHSSGHKKSSKLVDIVPKLLEKRLDQFDADSKKTENELNRNSSHSFSSKTKNFKSSDEEFILFHTSDNILSLENSRRCLKCGLLYIPELLDSFDICFTCKKKKVCETESRSITDVINELTKSHTLQNPPSTNGAVKELKNHTLSNEQRSAENIVIQEGNESSLRPAINQVDLTSVDAPLLDTTESDTDDYEVVCARKLIDKFDKDSDTNSSFCIDFFSQPAVKSNRTQNNIEVDPLRIDFSNPSTPVKNSQSNTFVQTVSSSQDPSPPPWTLEVSNPPTASASYWPGYMAPRSPKYLPGSSLLEPILPSSLPSCYSLTMDAYGITDQSKTTFANSSLISSYSPMSFSSIYIDSFSSKYMKPKPILIDLENDSVDMESVDKYKPKSVTNMSISSTEDICLSDSDESEKSVEFKDEDRNIVHENLENTAHNTDEFHLNLDVKPEERHPNNKINKMDTDQTSGEQLFELTNEKLMSDKCSSKNISVSPSKNFKPEEMELGEYADADMLLSTPWSDGGKSEKAKDNSNQERLKDYEDQNNGQKQNEIVSEGYDQLTSTLDFSRSDSLQKHIPRSLEEKLLGLTDFSPSVLRGINNENGLSFHNIISDFKPDNSSEFNPDSAANVKTTVQSFTGDSLKTRSPQCSFPDDVSSSNSVFVNSFDLQMDSLVGNLNENLNSIDRFEIENITSEPNSASMNSLCLSGNFGNILNENSNIASLGSPVSVTMESVDDDNKGVICDSSTTHPMTSSLFPFETKSTISGLSSSEHIPVRPSVIPPYANGKSCSPSNQIKRFDDDNGVSSSIDPNFDSDEYGKQIDADKNKLIAVSDDHQDTSDDTENYTDLHETEFSSESDLENCLSQDSDDNDDNTKTVEFRVDILHSEKELSNNFAKIFESSDSD